MIGREEIDRAIDYVPTNMPESDQWDMLGIDPVAADELLSRLVGGIEEEGVPITIDSAVSMAFIIGVISGRQDQTFDLIRKVQ